MILDIMVVDLHQTDVKTTKCKRYLFSFSASLPFKFFHFFKLDNASASS